MKRKPKITSPDELRRAGMQALSRALGVSGMLRFMQQFDAGRGDYTRDRHRIVGNPSVDELFGEMKAIEGGAR